METDGFETFSFSPMKKHPKIVMMINVPMVDQAQAPCSKWICLCTHSDKTTRQFIQFNEEVKPISIEKIIRLAKCLLSGLFGFLKRPERPRARLADNF